MAVQRSNPSTTEVELFGYTACVMYNLRRVRAPPGFSAKNASGGQLSGGARVRFVCERERWGGGTFASLPLARGKEMFCTQIQVCWILTAIWRLGKQGVVARYLGREYHPLHLHIPHANHELLIPGACVGIKHTLFLCPANAHAAALPLLLPSQMNCDGLL